MPAPANPDVAWAIEDIRANLPRRQKALNYYNGEHPLNFATTKFRNTFGELFQELADNLCDDVVDEPTNRLQIDNWTGKQSAAAQEWWESQRGDARSGSVHQHGHRAGDAFVIVWTNGDDDEPRMYVQDPRQMAVRYSASYPDRVEVAAKCWREGKGYRLNLYYGPNADPRDPTGRVEHYYSKGVSTQSGEKGIPQAGAFSELNRVTLDADGQAQDVPWYEPHDKQRNPVFHFPNGELGMYGRSVLADVYPLQDAHNKLLCDFLVAGEGAALPKRFASGIQVVTDPVTGQEVSPFKEGANFWWTAKDTARMSQFPATEMKGFLDSMDAMALKIARKGGLPAHSVNISGDGNAPSGLSLLISEGKLIKRCKDRTRDWGVVWKELMAFVLTFQANGDPESVDVDLEWAPIETRDEKALLENLILKKSAVGAIVPDAQFAREAGYDDKELEEFAKEKEDETAKKLDAAQAAMGGRISPPGPPAPGFGGTAPAPPAPPGGAAQPAPPGSRA